MMNKKIAVGLAACLVAGASFAGTINYFNTSANKVHDLAGTAIPGNPGVANYIVALVEVKGGGVDDLTTGGFTDDVFLGTTWFKNPFVPGIVNANVTDDGGKSVYGVVFNADDVTSASDLGSATHFAYMFGPGGADASAVPSFDKPTDVFAFDMGGVMGEGSAPGQWQQIPEPGTMALFGLGALVIAVRRKFRK